MTRGKAGQRGDGVRGATGGELIFIDDHILWAGSLNPLSQSSTQEVMERRDSRAIVEDYTQLLRLDELIGAYAAGETVCPYCGKEVFAAEGRDDAFYWRCVDDPIEVAEVAGTSMAMIEHTYGHVTSGARDRLVAALEAAAR